ncbi:hypothetical protein FV242_31985 [Methylobacterium sp. WL64]|uniref:hypothetical protein n=1 Tax=Methylobacterium sp. WL64 TaxID=2603894 RepID=UPI0011CA04B1|nr:hypothetical protein [Methylobacterium sp. WL64]TXM97292.1 hypothetical protein FV242_31985 [Methylobacterium sp. WL64]
MSNPEPDELFRTRLLRVVTDTDRVMVRVARGPQLDTIGRKYDRFRTGVPLKGMERTTLSEKS